MIRAYGKLGVNMSLKIHLLDARLECIPENCGAFSDEHGERFHQEMAFMEIRFKGKNIARSLAEYCWSIRRDTNPYVYKRSAKTEIFLNSYNPNET